MANHDFGHNRLPGDRAGRSEQPADRARERLSGAPHASLRRVACSHNNGSLVLRGRVGSYYLKQLAQELVRSAEGVGAIVNQLEVGEVDDPPADDAEDLRDDDRRSDDD